MEWDVPLAVLIFQAQNMEPPVSTEIFTVGLWTYPSTEPLRSSLGTHWFQILGTAFGGLWGKTWWSNWHKPWQKKVEDSEILWHAFFLQIWGMAIVKV